MWLLALAPPPLSDPFKNSWTSPLETSPEVSLLPHPSPLALQPPALPISPIRPAKRVPFHHGLTSLEGIL